MNQQNLGGTLVEPNLTSSDYFNAIHSQITSTQAKVLAEITKLAEGDSQEFDRIVNCWAYLAGAFSVKNEEIDDYKKKHKEKFLSSSSNKGRMNKELILSSALFKIKHSTEHLHNGAINKAMQDLVDANIFLGSYQQKSNDILKHLINASLGGKEKGSQFDLSRDFVLKEYNNKTWPSKKNAAETITPLLTIYMKRKGLGQPVKTNRFRWVYDLLRNKC